MAFDVQAARKAGYTDDEIADFLGNQSKFDVAGARKAGYTAPEIVGFLSQAANDAKPDQGLTPLDTEQVTSARPWQGAGAGRGSPNDPRRVDVERKPETFERPGFAQGFEKALGESERPLTPGGLLLRAADAFTGGSAQERYNKAQASVLDDKTSPTLATDFAKAQQAPKQPPRLEPRTDTISPTGGVVDALKDVPINVARSTGSTLMNFGALAAEMGLTIQSAEQFRKAAADLDKAKARTGLGVSDEPLLKTGTAADALIPSAKTIADYAPEGIKQLGMIAAMGPAAIVADAGARGVSKAREDGLGLIPSLLYGAGQAATEGVPEAVSAKFAIEAAKRIPLGAALRGDAKAVTTAVQQTAQTMGVEFGSEQASALGNWVVDKIAADPTATPDRLVADMQEAVKATMVQGPTMLAGAKALQTAATGMAQRPEQAAARALAADLESGQLPAAQVETLNPNLAIQRKTQEGLINIGAAQTVDDAIAAAAQATAATPQTQAVDNIARLLGETPDVSQPGNIPAVDSGTAGLGAPEPAIGMDAGVGVSGAAERALDAGSAGNQPDGGTAPLADRGTAPALSPDIADTASRIRELEGAQRGEPASMWFGRRGDGYQTPEDASAALPSRQRVSPDLEWKVEQMPSGRYRLAGYDTQAQQPAPAFQVTLNPTGTATIIGDPAAIKATLAQAGIDKVMAGTDRVVVGTSQAQAAVQALEQKQPKALANTAQPAIESVANDQNNQTREDTQAQAPTVETPAPAGGDAPGAAAKPATAGTGVGVEAAGVGQVPEKRAPRPDGPWMPDEASLAYNRELMRQSQEEYKLMQAYKVPEDVSEVLKKAGAKGQAWGWSVRGSVGNLSEVQISLDREDGQKATITAEYMGMPQDVRTATGAAAIAEAIERAKKGLDEGVMQMARKVAATRLNTEPGKLPTNPPKQDQTGGTPDVGAGVSQPMPVAAPDPRLIPVSQRNVPKKEANPNTSAEPAQKTPESEQVGANDQTPKQYHDARLRKMSDDTGTPLAEVREFYDTEGGRAESDRLWSVMVDKRARDGATLTRQTLDKFYELNPTARLPETAFPNGYQRPDARKQEAIAKDAIRQDRREAKAARAASEEQTGPYGRDLTPIAQGGKPFKTLEEAKDYRKKNTNNMVVKKVGKNQYVLQDATPKQIAAWAKAGKRLGVPQTGGEGPQHAHGFLIGKGSLSKKLMADAGFDRNRRFGNRMLFADDGMTAERATELLAEAGYLKAGASHSDMFALVRKSVQTPQYTSDGWEQLAQAEQSTRFEDHLAVEQEAATEEDPFGPAEAFTPTEIALVPKNIREEYAALMEAAEAAGVDVDAILEDAARISENQTQEQFNEYVRQAHTDAIADSRRQADRRESAVQGREDAQRGGTEGSRQDTGRPGAQEEGLTAPTPAQVLEQQDRAARAEELDQREQIQREAEGFQLQAQAPEQRSDNTGDMFGGPSVEDAERVREEKRKAEAEAKAKKDAESGQAPMFSRAAKEDPRDLIIQHNLTADNLLFAARMGGLAVPSLAITKAESPMKNFGEITLLGDVNMADPRQGIKAYGADIYSPRYPRVTYQFTPNMRARAEKQVKAGLDATNTYIDWSEVERDGADELNRQPALMWEFLTSKGITPTIVRVEPKPLDPAIQPFANDTRNSFELAQDPAFQAAAWATHQEELTQIYGDAKEAQAEIEKMQQTARERGRSQVVNEYANGLDQYRRDKAVAGRVDASATKRAMDAQIHDAGLTDEFRASNKQLMRDLAPNERMFQGYTDSGKRRYKPHTLDNVIAILKKELRGGENFNYGAGSLRAKFTPQFKSVAQIRANKDRLVSNAQFEAIKEEANNDLQMIAESLNKPTDTAIAIMEDAPRMGLARAAAQYDVALSDSQREMIGEYMTRLRNMPTEYFEGKLLRAVGIGEFKAAVVPENVSDDVLTLLDREGVTVFRYTGNRDSADRARAIQQAANEIPGLMFSRTPAWRSELRDQPGGMPLAKAQSIVADLTKKWKNAPPIEVVATPSDLPMGAPEDARGVYWQGKVWVVAGPHKDRADIAKTLGHEAIAHFGLKNILTASEWDGFMRNIQMAIKSKNKALTAIRDDIRKRYVDESGKLYLTEKQEADEIAAAIVEQAIGPDGDFRPGFGFVKSVYAKIVQFLRDLGLDVKLTLAEVQGMLVLAQKNLEAGKRTVGQGDVVVAAGRGDQALSRTGQQVMQDLSRIGTKIASMGYEPEGVPNLQASRKLAALVRKLEEGKISEAYFAIAVKNLSEQMADVSQTKAANRLMKNRERGADIVRERLIRARRQGDLDPDAVEFALWAIDQNPRIAAGLAISVVSPKQDEVAAGDYNPAAEIIRVFKGSDKEDTAVHEIMHHAERMMPEEMQAAIRQEWADSLAKAMKKATPGQRQALSLIPDAVAGSKLAYQGLVQAIQSGPLNYADHYQLVNPSEFWAVNAARLLQRGFESRDSIWGRIRNYIADMIQSLKGILGMRSDAPILRALEYLMDADNFGPERGGRFESLRMLTDIKGMPEGRFNDIGKDQTDPADPNIMFSRGDVDRRGFLIGTAAALASGPTQAETTLGRAKPLTPGVMDQRIPPEAEKALVGSRHGTTNLEGVKAIRQALDVIAKSGPAEVRALANEIAKLLPQDGIAVQVDKGDWNAHGAVELSPLVRLRLFDGARTRGMNYDTVLHEALHAVVVARYRSLSTGLVRSNDAKLGMPAPAAAAAMDQFQAVWREFQNVATRSMPAKGDVAGADLRLTLDEAIGNPDEFFVRALTDPTLQAWMAQQEYQGKTLLQRFIGWVKTSLLGLKTEGTRASWLDAALLASDDLLKAMAGDKPDFARLRAISTMASRRPQLSRATEQDVMFSRGTTAEPGREGWDMPTETRLDKTIYELQDGSIDLKRVQEAIKKTGADLEERFDARLAETLYPGRVAKRSENFLKTEVRPLLQAMALLKVNMTELGDYLIARHAPERNAQIAKINPDLSDGGAGRNSEGTLMTDDAAAEYLEAIPADKLRALETLAAKVDAITAGTRNLWVSEGLETPETVRAMERAYKHYVPLFKDEAEFSHPQGMGFSVRGAASKRAMGSTKEITNVLAHVLMAREAAINRAEKNRVGMALYGLALSYPNPDFWTVIRPNMSNTAIAAELSAMGVDLEMLGEGMSKAPTIRTIDPVTNTVVNRPNPAYKNMDNAMVIKVGGEDRVIVFNQRNERAMRMVGNLKNLDGLTKLELANSILGKATRYIAAVNTQYNPVFGLVNIIRDVQGSMLNLTTTAIKDKKRQVFRDIPAALSGIARDLRGDERTEWSDLWQQYQEDGGQTGYREMFRAADDRAKAIEKELGAMDRSTPGKAAHAVLDLMDDFNTALENAVRLSAYKAALDTGLSRKEAARLGKELTVNFNRKGRAGRELSPMYAFMNAAIQGNARLFETLRGPAASKIVAGGLMLGAAQALMLAAAGFDDDEIPEWVKARSLIIPVDFSSKRYITIPIALGFNMLPNTGRVLTEIGLNGGKDAKAKAVSAIGEILGSLSPVGGGNIFTADGALKLISPTVADPVIEIVANRNFAGAPIEREAMENDGRPGYQRARESTLRSASGQAYTGISRALNAMTMGTTWEAGAVSPSPEMVRYVARVFGGGLLGEIERVIDAGANIATGTETKSTRVPLTSRFYGEVDPAQVEQRRFFDAARKIQRIERSVKAAKKAGDDDEASRIEADNEIYQFAGQLDRVQSRMRKLNKQATETINNPAEIRDIDAARTDEMKALNDEVRAMEAERYGRTAGSRLRKVAAQP